jgi:hypothetical protein
MKRRARSLLVAAALLAACGVEVGNPNGEKPKTGTAQVYFARSRASEAGASFDLSLAKVQLRSGAAASTVVAELAAASEPVGLLSLTADDDDVLAASSDAVPVGTYAQVVVSFAEGAAAVYRAASGEVIEAAFDDEAARAVTIDAEIEITASESTAIVISLDPERSLVAREGQPEQRVFRPLGELMHRGRRAAYEGTTDIEGARLVCAYYYEPLAPPTLGQRPPPAGADGAPPPPPPPSEALRRRPTFATAAEVVKDESDACPNAFDRAPVREGRYSFRHLPPGKYDFRIFDADGFSEGPTGVQLQPPEPPPGQMPPPPGGPAAASGQP